jgi:hypothetical protein
MLAMKKLFVLALAAVLTPVAAAKVWVNVYQCDGRTPLAAVDANRPEVYRDIMVGTRLTFVISSDTSDSWGGDLLFSQDDAPYAKLSGRGFTYIYRGPGNAIKIPTYKDSCLDAAGTKATVQDSADAQSIGLGFGNDTTRYITGGHPAYPGDWFVVDYYAELVEDCKVELYGGGLVSPVVGVVGDPGVVPVRLLQTLSFTHVSSRDFNSDTVVNFKDFALLASHGRSAIDPNSSGEAAVDLKADRRVEVSDLMSFSQYWLEQTDCSESPTESVTTTKP